ncbi:hypothetical protein [Nostoc sp. FACHB-888]|uniref:hypothetical protein n=1 Tax=Nostoc sp. FACHB-888 TaxID=2692842 RepID=UPI0018F012CB|nr:hypothetical protein [Nostoc sp. FACHB-888]
MLKLNPQKLPFLESIGWQLKNVYQMSKKEIVQLYQRNWHHQTTFKNLKQEEKDFVHYFANPLAIQSASIKVTVTGKLIIFS